MKKATKRTLKIMVLLGLLTGLLLGLTTTTYAAGSKVSTKAQAKKIALDKVNLKSSDVTWLKVKKDNWDDDGDIEWEVKFKTSTYKYEIEINARTGRIEDYEIKKIKAAKTTKISEKKAREIALKAFNLTESDVKIWTKVRLDDDEWDIKFKTATHKYEVEISTFDGRVKDKEKKKIASSASAKKITKAEAQSIALKDAKKAYSLTGNPDYEPKVKLDHDDGIEVYEVEFRYGRWEYEYEIEASTGEIISAKRDD